MVLPIKERHRRLRWQQALGPEAPRSIIGIFEELVVRPRVQINEALHLSDDSVILRFLPSIIGALPTDVVHQDPIPAGSHLTEILQVCVSSLSRMVAVNRDDVALDVGVPAFELGQGVFAVAEDKLEAWTVQT